MIDVSAATPDALPLTGIPILDATVKLIGALAVLATVLSQTLPKAWAFTQWIAQRLPAADFKGVVPQAAAKKEAAAQAIGETTVPGKPLPMFPIDVDVTEVTKKEAP